MSGSQTKSGLEGQKLIEYSVRQSGSRKGNSKRTVLAVYDENRARLTVSCADRYDDEPVVTEYLVDRKVLSDIQAAFLRHGMEGWAGKKFSNSIVRDGKTVSYSFVFSEAQVGFSSQIYPRQYAEALKELDQIIEKYRIEGQSPADKIRQE